MAKVTTAKNKAAQVVAQNAGKSDYEKLVAYKNYICDQVTYNDAAADNDNTPYGDPWQLISVFDSDFTTNVVCEGYSKAFQYLCDLSGLDCISVSGTMSSSTSSGAHMWNVVTLDGSNYLVDVTNTDTGTVGQGGELFLAGGTYKNGGYSFSCGYQTVVFTCSDLGLAATNYTYQPPIATYSVTVADSENGIVTADPTNAAAGTEIQLTVTPDAGYVLDTLTVTWSDDQVIEVTDSKFTMPAGDVTVVAVFKEEPAVVMGTVNADNLNVRSAPSSTADILKRLAINTRIKILELRTVDGVNWGRIAEGWVNLNFVSIDEPNLTGTCGDNLTWKLNTDGVLTISGTGDMYDYSFENTPWYAYREVITGVAIEDGVTKIGNWAFNMCTNLISATIPDGITVIGDDAFSNCNSLTNITIPNSTLSIGNFALHDCISLTDVTIPDSVTTIGSHVFSHCTSLETVIIGSNISSIDSSVFFDCSNLTTIRFCGDMPNLGDNCFSGITATAYYPANRTGWTSDAMLQAGGTITWKSYGASEVAQNGTAKYETLQAAISAASAGDIITLLADIDEIVGINRPLTIMTNGFSLNEDNIFCGKYLNEKGEKVQLTLKEIAGGYVITPMVSSGQEEGDAYAYIDGQESLLPLQTALDEAEKLYKAQTGTKTNVVVKLSGDISINSIVVIPSGVTLNIGTHTLSVRSLIGVEGSYLTATSIANDGTGDYGILKAAKKNVILPEAALVEASTKDYNITVLPVWNPDAAHYEFCRFILWHNATKAMGLEVDEEKEHIKFIFRHQNSTYYQSHLLNKSGTDSGLRVVLEISWKVLDEEGGVLGTPYQTFVYTDKHFTTIAPGGYNYTFNLHGYSAMFLDLDTMLIQTKVISDTGAIAYGKPIDYSFDKLT